MCENFISHAIILVCNILLCNYEFNLPNQYLFVWGYDYCESYASETIAILVNYESQ